MVAPALPIALSVTSLALQAVQAGQQIRAIKRQTQLTKRSLSQEIQDERQAFEVRMELRNARLADILSTQQAAFGVGNVSGTSVEVMARSSAVAASREARLDIQATERRIAEARIGMLVAEENARQARIQTIFNLVGGGLQTGAQLTQAGIAARGLRQTEAGLAALSSAPTPESSPELLSTTAFPKLSLLEPAAAFPKLSLSR